MARHFPRALGRASVRRRALTAVTGVAASGLLLGSALVPSAAMAEDDLEGKKDKVEKKIDKVEEEFDESSAELQTATAALLRAQADLALAQEHLAQTRGELAAAQALDQQMQRRLEAAVARLEKARAELEAGRADVSSQEAELRQMVVSSYEQGDPALMGLSMLFTTQDPADLTGTLNANDAVLDVESAVLDQLEATKVLLQVQEAEMEAAKEEVARRRAEAAENLLRKEALELQAEQAEEQVSEMVTLRKEAHEFALKAKNADLAALAKLQVERDRIEELIAEQASMGGVYTGPLSGNGFLSMPVDGSITSPFGWRTHPIWGYQSLHDGIDFGAGCGTPIVAPADGVVLSEYYQTAWGNRIIIDHGIKHGVGVATISNHLEGYAVSVGDEVERGEVVGYVGTTGWSTGCHLHFTVLQNGAPIDPMNWL